jgi:MFS family permease
VAAHLTHEPELTSPSSNPSRNAAEKTARPAELWLVSGTALAALLAPLNSTMLAVALPQIRSQFEVGVGPLTWLISSYLIAVAVMQPAGGRLGDAFGHLRVIVGGLLILVAFSVAAAFAWDFPSLVITRSLQGIGAALVMPNVSAYLRKRVEPERLSTVLGFNGSAISAGAAGGPLLGGALLALWDWRLLFLANVPLGLLALVMVLRLPRDVGAGRPALSIDLVSLLALAGAFTGVSLVGSAFRLGQPALTVAGLSLLPVSTVVYALRFRAKRRGVVDLRLFTRRNYRVAAAGVSLSNLVMYTTLIAMPVYLRELRGQGEGHIALMLFAMSALMVVASPFAGRIADAMGSKPPMLAGSLLLLAAAGGLALSLGDPPLAFIVVLLGVVGLSFGISSAPQQSVGLRAWEVDQAGSASGTLSMMRYVGSITGAAALAGILGSDPTLGDFRLLFGVVVLFAVANVGAVFRLEGEDRLAEPRQALPAGVR